MNIFLVRHAASLRKTVGVWGRLFDADLGPESVFQLEHAKRSLADLPDRAVFSSPLMRCLKSAEVIFGPDEPIVVVAELRAYDSGALEQRNEEYVKQHHPTYLAKSFKERFTELEFGEESIPAQAQRVRRGMRSVLKAAATNVIVVTHYSVINIVAALATSDFDTSRYGDGRVDVAEGGLVTLTVDSDALLRALSDLDGGHE